MNDIKLAVRDIRVERAGRTILDVPELDVRRGEVLAIVGPNGAGKSTLLHVLALLERPTAGKVLFDAEPTSNHLLSFRRRMAVVFQEPLLLDTTVEANCRSGLALRGVPGSEQGRRVAQWLERFAIAHLARRSARTLSGGEAQRVSLVRAFVLEPEVLLLDEPFAALDPPTREALMDDLERGLRDAETTAVLVTHDRTEALRLGDRVAVMIGGRVRQVGSAGEVFASPVDEEVAAFVGVETVIPGEVCAYEGGLALIAVGGRRVEAVVEGLVGRDVLVCLRPEDVVLGPPSDSGPHTSARNRLLARVQRILPAGAQARVILDCGFPLVALITKQSLADLALRPGDEVLAAFKATAVHLIPHRTRS